MHNLFFHQRKSGGFIIEKLIRYDFGQAQKNAQPGCAFSRI
jgi:hypothetical protein